MFRPAQETPLFRKIPFRLIAAVLLILALAISVLLVFSLEHEKFVVHELIEGKTVPTELFLALWQSRQDLIAITVLLFLVSAIGIAAVITFLHYDSTRRTLEAVKGLARNILESIPTGVLTVNRSGLITAVNPATVSILKRSTSELLGNSYESVFAEGDTIRMVLDGALHRHHYLDHKDLPYEGDGQRLRTIRVTTADLTGDEGRSAGALLLVEDTTELLTLEQRVRMAEKLAGLHTLSAGVAHELRNPLSAMDLNLHLLEEELREKCIVPTQASHYLQVLNAECRRLSVILDNFMKFSRPGPVKLHEVDVRGVIAHILALLQYEGEEQKVRLMHSLEEELPPVLGDETQISQVLVNIVVNAFQAMPDGGLCRIAAAGRHIEGKDWIEISVQDTGVGIKKEDLSRLYEPFYTTKAGGSGLGLAVAYRIIQDHEGTIQVSSTPGSGTSVVIRLPVASVRRQTLMVGR
jgi:PAS domain S-box-containing protein